MTASRRVLLFVLPALLQSAGALCAFERPDVERLKALNRCVSCNLSGADLTGVNLAYADLAKADLSKANLSGVQLGQAKLAGANLTGANLSGARLIDAWLYKATLDGVDLSGADLSDALWVDGKKCGPDSRGECVVQVKQNEDGKTPSSPSQ